MKLEGIHHITAITGDAQRNVDFYAGTLGLRMVKKTVNQDEPSVYHLFYADEQGSPGSDITFFEFPGAPRGPRRRRHGPPDRLAGRAPTRRSTSGPSGSAAAGVETSREDGRLRFADPEGLDHELVVAEVADAPLIADHPEVPAELALQGFQRRARLLRRIPRRSAGAAAARSSSSAPATAPGRRAATAAAASGPTTSRRPSAGSTAPARCTTSPGRRRWTSTSLGASGRSRAAPARRR